MVLHAHLPFVRHPEEEYFLEENWLYEAITETYIPLIHVFERLINEGIYFRLTISFTPPLISMLKDRLLQERYLRHINKLIELAQKEIERTGYDPRFHGLALMYYKRFMDARDTFLRYRRDLISVFKGFQERGYLEILASCATHGYLPILSINPEDVRAQINIGVDYYKKTFACSPKGFWLPECGYYPGVEEVLKEAGIRYFFVDSHALINADPSPRYSVYAPVYCPCGVAAFARDWESSKQVWSSKEGYPGDVDYREYYRDIGFDLDYEYIKPYIHPLGIRINTGIKYYRITGNTEYKEPYLPDWAREKAALHAGNFMFNREKQIEYLASQMDRRPIVVAPYDAELFGHWWFEGPMWLEFLFRKLAYDQKNIRLIIPSEYLAEYPCNQVCLPTASSWGWKGYNEFWLAGENDWLYRHLHNAGRKMKEIAQGFASEILYGRKNSLRRRALNQLARELLLAQASDWAFIMKTQTMVSYAQRRVKMHLNRFLRLYHDLLHNSLENEWLKEVEFRDNIFGDLDCARYYLDLKDFKAKNTRKLPKIKAREVLLKA